MATANINLPTDLLPKLEEIARSENRTAEDLAREVLEKYVARRIAASELDELSKWGQQYSSEMGFKASDVLPAIADVRRKRNSQ